MRHLKNKFAQYAALLVFFAFPPMAHALENSELIQTLQTNYQIITQFDHINLNLTEAYLDCFCKVLNENGGSDARCNARATSTTFSQVKINHLGQEVTEVKICTEVVNKTMARVQKAIPGLRTNLAVIAAYQKAATTNTFNLHIERPQNRKQLAKHILQSELTHLNNLHNIAAVPAPLTPVEFEVALDRHFKYSEDIRESFIRSKNYQLFYENLNSDKVADYLKNDISAPLENELKNLKLKNRNLSFDAWYSMQSFKELFRQHLIAEKAQIVLRLTKDYQRELNSLPVLSFLQSSEPTVAEVLSAFFKINQNAKIRTKESILAASEIYGPPVAGEEDYWIAQFAFLMDHRLGTLNLAAVLKNKTTWSEEKIAENISYLISLRAEQIKTAQLAQTVAMIGTSMLCLAPFPGSKALSVGARLLVKNFCMLGVSGGVNTYFVLDSHSISEQKISQFLSSADGWNQVTKHEQIIGQQREYESWILFYALLALPARQIGKYFWSVK